MTPYVRRILLQFAVNKVTLMFTELVLQLLGGGTWLKDKAKENPLMTKKGG